MRIVLLILFSLFSLLSLSINADAVPVSDPNQVIRLVSVNTLERINLERSKLEAEPDYIKVVIEEELIPYLDFKYAAYKVMGTHLKNTTKEQRTAFVVAFRSYLINAYGHILFEYDQQEVEIIDNKHYKDKKIISIPVRIHDQSGQVTQIAFKLRKNKKTGEWKVFDVIAEGISMLNTKQSELNELIHKEGVDYVIALLQKKNREF